MLFFKNKTKLVENLVRGGLVVIFFVSGAYVYGCGPLTEVDIDRGTVTVPDIPTYDPFGAPSTPETPPPPPEAAPEPPPSAEQPPPPQPPAEASPAATATNQLNALGINDDFSSLPKYDRKRFKHWSDLTGDRCNARQTVLIRQELYGRAQVDAFGCQVVTGDWLSPYDNVTTTNPGEFDVDHVVALGEAWRAGAWQWDDPKRERFANDLDSRQLIAVSASSNRSKSDKRPDQWMPPNTDFRCQFLFDWVEVKHIWELTVATPEKSFIANELTTC